MAISLRNAGTWAAVNAATQTVTLPAHQTGDLLIVRVGMKHGTMPGDITCDTANWVRIDQHNSGVAASSNGGGSVQIAAFYKVAASASETNPVIRFHASTAATPGCAVGMAYQKAANETWVAPVADGGTISVATNYSATMGSHIAAASGDMLDGFVVTNDNTTLTVPTLAQTGLTLNAVTESPAAALSDATSNDIAADGCFRLATAGTSSAAATFSGTNSAADEGAAMVIRLRVQAAAPQNVEVPAGSLTLTAAAPTVAVTNNVRVEVPAATLSLTAAAPTVLTPQTVTPPAGSLTLTGAAPSVLVGVRVEVPAAALTLTAAAPTATATDHKTITPPAATLTLTGAAPTVTTSDHKRVDVPAATLTLTAAVPAVGVSDHKRVDVPSASLTLTAAAPTVTVGGGEPEPEPEPEPPLDAADTRMQDGRGPRGRTPWDDWTIQMDDDAIVELYVLRKTR